MSSQPPPTQQPQAQPQYQQPQLLLQQQQQPPLSPAQQKLESALLSLFQSLTELQTVSGSVVPGSENLVALSAERTIKDLANLSALKPEIAGGVHPTVLELVEQDKNPHQFTRDTLERAAGENQYASGKLEALSSYASLLDASLLSAFPALAGSLPSSPRPAAPQTSAGASSGGTDGRQAESAPAQGVGGGEGKMDWSTTA